MSELAFNVNGEPFEVPGETAAWRVRRLKQKGAPEVVYGRDGLPLVLPLEAELDDLRREAGGPGRYRLDPIDETHRAIPNAQAGYVFIHPTERVPEAAPSVAMPPSDNIVIEAMRMNHEMAKTVIDRFPQMMEAAATLLRAADGAGLPARLPTPVLDVTSDDDDDLDELEGEDIVAGFDLNALVAQTVPMLVRGLMNGTIKLPGIGALLDWRKAAAEAPAAQSKPEPESERIKPAKAPKAVKATPAPASEAALPPMNPAALAHFAAVQAALSGEERELAREAAANLSAAELRAWFDELSKLSVPEAAARIRKIISELGKGDVS